MRTRSAAARQRDQLGVNVAETKISSDENQPDELRNRGKRGSPVAAQGIMLNKKTRVLEKMDTNISNSAPAENSSGSPAMPPVSLSSSGRITKRISLSKDEREMNGAPEGDIYDAKFIEDDDLVAFDSEHEALDLLISVVADDFDSKPWSATFEAVLQLRRIFVYEPAILSTPDDILRVVDIIVSAIVSLRSVSVKNAIACTRILLDKCDALLLETSTMEKILSALMNRTASGPRFICDAAYDVLQRNVQRVPALTFIQSLSGFTDHKNPELCNKAAILVSLSCCRNISRANISTYLTVQPMGGVYDASMSTKSATSAALAAPLAEAKKQFEALTAAGHDVGVSGGVSAGCTPNASTTNIESTEKRLAEGATSAGDQGQEVVENEKDDEEEKEKGGEEEDVALAVPPLQEILTVLANGMKVKKATGRDAALKGLRHISHQMDNTDRFLALLGAAAGTVLASEIQRQLSPKPVAPKKFLR